MLTLLQAIRESRLSEFIDQQEAACTGPNDEATFDLAASKVIKHEPQSDQTSRYAYGDGWTGKRTR